MPDIEAERRAVVAEARTWLRTPYHHMGRVKGAGVDCATLLAEVYVRAGIVRALAIPFYPPDWHLHRNAERYLDFILAHAREYVPDFSSHDGRALESDAACATRPVLPGDVAMWRFGKCFSHGAIVVDWPVVIHAYAGKGCVLEDTEKAAWLSRLAGRRRDDERPVKFFTLRQWASQNADALNSDAPAALRRAAPQGSTAERSSGTSGFATPDRRGERPI